MLYHEKAEHQKTCAVSSTAGSLVRTGPCGGIGGNVRETSMSDVNRIVQVIVRHWNAVDAISVMYERKGKEAWADRWGGEGGKPSTFSLQQDEYLTSVHGHYGQFKDFVVIRSLTFVSNLRSYGPYGKEDGVPFALHAGPGGKIMGFHARSGQFLDAIGTYVKMDNY
ncbi:hypothetical protein CFC21_045445 [Triticum aestivum]|uniref:Jacalin-type lectin domain-containing protein n=2 Tax=Triticum aestivum TaxID=4565 RepID=A0A9R1FT24_WHEAT|nr:hypothetical protein CFC21_045443 [Triticum aestivum]KAF7034426.1 hypothetical protein CFC21_045445 [Triticum aestivum]